MSVRSRLIGQAFVQAAREVQSAQKEYKAKQTIGSDSLLLNRVKSTADYDIMLPMSGATTRKLLVTYTPSENAFGGAVPYRMYVKSWNSAGIRGRYADTLIERQRSVNGVHGWRVTVSDYENVYVKLYFAAIGSGNFTVTVLP